MRLQDPREAEVVLIRQRPAAFSFFPTYRGERREGVHSTLFSSDPWNLMRTRIDEIRDDLARRQSLAFLSQAKDFYSASQISDVSSAKPLLLYYSFLNLAKAYIVHRQNRALGSIRHGLSETLPNTEGTPHGSVSIDISKSPDTSAFIMLAKALRANLPATEAGKTHVQIRSQDFLSQILIGHRIFCEGEHIKERFVSLDRIDYMKLKEKNELIARARAYADDFSRLNYPMTDLSKRLSDRIKWINVKCEREIDGRRIIEAQTVSSFPYGQRPSQVIGNISTDIRSKIWRSVTIYPHIANIIYTSTLHIISC